MIIIAEICSFSPVKINDSSIVSATQTDICEDIHKRIYLFPQYQEAFIQIQNFIYPRGVIRPESIQSLFWCLFLPFFG